MIQEKPNLNKILEDGYKFAFRTGSFWAMKREGDPELVIYDEHNDIGYSQDDRYSSNRGMEEYVI